MEVFGVFDAKTRLSELVERASKGESFIITKHGHPVARLIPENGKSRERAKAAVQRLKQMRDTVRGVSTEEMIDSIHEGHKY